MRGPSWTRAHGLRRGTTINIRPYTPDVDVAFDFSMPGCAEGCPLEACPLEAESAPYRAASKRSSNCYFTSAVACQCATGLRSPGTWKALTYLAMNCNAPLAHVYPAVIRQKCVRTPCGLIEIEKGMYIKALCRCACRALIRTVFTELCRWPSKYGMACGLQHMYTHALL